MNAEHQSTESELVFGVATMDEMGPIKTEADHAAVLRAIEVLWGAPIGSPEGARLDALATIADAYEASRWPIEPLKPLDARSGIRRADGPRRLACRFASS